jgi:YD repeat-containing protein
LPQEPTDASTVVVVPRGDAAMPPETATPPEAGAAPSAVATSAASASPLPSDAGELDVEDAAAPSASVVVEPGPLADAAAEYPTVTFDPPGGVPWDPPLAVTSEAECIVTYVNMITSTNQTTGVGWSSEVWTYEDATGTLSRDTADFVFSPAGRLLLHTDLIQYERDSHGNMTRRTSGNSSAYYALVYDAEDRLVESTDGFADWPAPGGASLLRRTYEYDAAGRCAATSYNAEMRESYFYDDQDRLIRRELRDGESLLGVAYYLYDEAGLVAWIEDGWNAASSTAPLDGLADHIVRRAPDGAGGFVIEELYFSLATAERNRPYGSFREYELPWYPVGTNAMVQREGETTSVSRSEIRVSAECMQLGLPQLTPTGELCTFDHAKPGLPLGWF